MRLTVHSDATLMVTAPKWVLNSEIEGFLNKQAEWILKEMDRIVKAGGKLFTDTKKDYKENKEKARKLVHERLEYFNQFYGFKWGRVSIRNQKTCWGSCSQKGNLNFNYKLALIPLELADYVIVHELCHLGELNHSKRFWNLVTRTIPRHKQARAKLRRNGLYLP